MRVNGTLTICFIWRLSCYNRKTRLLVLACFSFSTRMPFSYGVKVVQVIFDDVIKGGPKEAKLREDGALIMYSGECNNWVSKSL